MEISAEDMFYEFLYEDKVFNIFGMANSFPGAIETVHKLQLMGDENDMFDVALISSNLRGKGVTATYSFLSKEGSRAREIKFFKDDFEKWDNFDIIVDITPQIFQSKPEDKMAIRIEYDFNKWDIAEYSFKSLKEMYNDKNFIEQLKEFCKS